MKLPLPKHLLIIAVAALAQVSAVQAQTILYNENFDASSTALPTGWTTTTSGWVASASNASTGYPGASGVNNVKIDNSNSASGTYSLVTSSVVTTGYSNISVGWGARLTTNFPTSTISPYIYYSTDGGTTWTGVSYTEASSASTWTTNAVVNLPSAVNNQPSVMFQLVANIVHSTNGTYRIDDFTVAGTSSVTSVEEQTANACKVYAYGHTLYVNYENTSVNGSVVTLYSYDGKEVLRQELQGAKGQVNLDALPAGVYMAKIEGADHTLANKKIIVN